MAERNSSVVAIAGTYRNKRTGVYLVQPMTNSDRGFRVAYGDPIRVTDEEFDSTMGELVLRSLDEYNRIEYRDELSPHLTEQEHRDFVRTHDHVGITLLSSGVLEVTPCRRRRQGYVGFDSGSITINRSDGPERLAQTIREAFSRTS